MDGSMMSAADKTQAESAIKVALTRLLPFGWAAFACEIYAGDTKVGAIITNGTLRIGAHVECGHAQADDIAKELVENGLPHPLKRAWKVEKSC